MLLGAESPRRLEDMTAGQLGARVHETVREGHSLALGDWIGWLIDAAEERVRERLVSGVPDGQAALLLLHGLSSVGSPAIARTGLEAVSRLRPVVRGSQVASALPQWRDAVAKLRMTGDIWVLRDVYGSRLGVVAATVYPDGMDPAVYLFDIVACGFVVLAGGGTFHLRADDRRGRPNPAGRGGRHAGASVPRRGPKLEPLLLSDDERTVLERWLRR
ncbi:hypothetical protein, partial [Streptomyces sp. NPDC060027]|uniref:hypothetical protein n=1 Tax=Streptomyces sp. NPDC060027 TaxID=3347040 RepID=UPI0036BC3302